VKRFEKMQLTDAMDHAEQGGQALHVFVPMAVERQLPHVQTCFRRSTAWAHLFDKDGDRLQKTARELGVSVVKIHHAGTPRQHVDLCGKPLKLAIKRCEE